VVVIPVLHAMAPSSATAAVPTESVVLRRMFAVQAARQTLAGAASQRELSRSMDHVVEHRDTPVQTLSSAIAAANTATGKIT